MGASAGLSQDLSPLRLHVACQGLTSMTGFPPKKCPSNQGTGHWMVARGGLNQISHHNQWWQLVTELFFYPCLMLNVIQMFRLSCFVLETLSSHRIIHHHVITKPFLAFGGSSSIIVFSRVLYHTVAVQTLEKASIPEKSSYCIKKSNIFSYFC